MESKLHNTKENKMTNVNEPMRVNGFTFKSVDCGPRIEDRRYEAHRGELVIKSKSLDYLIKKVKKLPQESQV